MAGRRLVFNAEGQNGRLAGKTRQGTYGAIVAAYTFRCLLHLVIFFNAASLLFLYDYSSFFSIFLFNTGSSGGNGKMANREGGKFLTLQWKM